MPRPKTTLDETKVRTLLEQGLTHRAIANRLHTSKATLTRTIKQLGLGKTPQASTKSTPTVDIRSDEVQPANSPELPDTLSGDLAELVTWWQDRKAAMSQASDASRQTERTTFHVEKRWVDAIKLQADRDDATYTHIVNDAFRQYFTHK